MIEFRDNRWTFVSPTRVQDRSAAFVPDLAPAEFGPVRALLEITERFASIVGERMASLTRRNWPPDTSASSLSRRARRGVPLDLN